MHWYILGTQKTEYRHTIGTKQALNWHGQIGTK